MTTTLKQRRSVFFITRTLSVNFYGDLSNPVHVKSFLNKYFEEAKKVKKQQESCCGLSSININLTNLC